MADADNQRPGGAGPGRDPALLAAAAGGMLAALAALWAFRGLPAGTALFWLAPLPLFAAGLAFGPGLAFGAAAVAALAVLALGGTLPLLAFGALFAVPVPLLVAAGLRRTAAGGGEGRARLETGLPLAVLGLWPAAAILLAAFALSGRPDGLEGAMRLAVEAALARMELPADGPVVEGLVRVKAAAIAFWAVVTLAVTGIAAQGALARQGLALAPTPAWRDVRLPDWYPLAPAIAAGAYLAAPEGADAVQLSVLLTLLLPPLLQGLAAAHRLAAGRRRGRLWLFALYALLLLFAQLVAPALMAWGLSQHLTRRSAPDRP